MHGTITRIAVLMQVEGEKVFVASKFLWRHLFVLWRRKTVRADSLEFYYGLPGTSALPNSRYAAFLAGRICSMVHCSGFFSGRQRRNFVPWRKRPPEK
jgi:hypothetical protein